MIIVIALLNEKIKERFFAMTNISFTQKFED